MLILLNFWKVERRELQKEIPLKLQTEGVAVPSSSFTKLTCSSFTKFTCSSCPFQQLHQVDLQQLHQVDLQQLHQVYLQQLTQQLHQVYLQQLHLTCSSFSKLTCSSFTWPAAASPSWPAAASLDLEQLTRYRSHLAPTSVQNCNNSNLPRLHRIFYVASVFNNCHSTFILFCIPSLSLHMYCQFSG